MALKKRKRKPKIRAKVEPTVKIGDSGKFMHPVLEPEETVASCPYKKGQVLCDVKIVEINHESARPVHYLVAKRGRIEKNGLVISADGGDAPILKNPITHKVVWDEYIHMMTVADFASMVEGKRKVQGDVE